MRKVLVGIPTTGNICTGLASYLLSLKDATILFAEDKWLSEARNNLIQYGMIHGYNHLMFIDSDTYPTSPDIMDRMLEEDKDIVCAPYWMQPSPKPGTSDWATRMVEFVWDKDSKEYLINDLGRHEKGRYVDGWLPIGFSLINLDTIRACGRSNWFGTNQSVHEDKTFALNALSFNIKFYLFGESVKHCVRTVI